MKAAIGRFAFRIARSPGGGRLVAAATRLVPRLLPGAITVLPALVVLRHPAPMEPGHLLVVPRSPIADFSVSSAPMTTFLRALDAYASASGIADEGGHLATNLGSRQDVRLLHVHYFPSSSRATTWHAAPDLVACHQATVDWAGDATSTGGTVMFRRPGGAGKPAGWEWAVDGF